MESKHRQYSSSNDTSINDDYDIYGNRHDTRLYGYSGIYGNSECDPECFSELTEHMCRHHSRFSGKRCYELCMESEYRQRRICNDPKLNDDDDLYSNRNHWYLQQNSSSDGNGNGTTTGSSELTKYLFWFNGKFNRYRSDELYLESEYWQRSIRNDTNLNDDDDVYGNRHDR